jgi:predicted DNA-binding transcriptional regulator YafY
MVQGTAMAEVVSIPGGSCPRVVTHEWLDNAAEKQATAFVVLTALAEVPPDDQERVFSNLWLFLDALREGSAVVTLYAHDGETSARVAFPLSVRLTKENQLAATCYCTKAQATRTFRMERIADAHAFSTPDDAPQQRVA